MINKYKWYEVIGIYLGIGVFLSLMLAPFFLKRFWCRSARGAKSFQSLTK